MKTTEKGRSEAIKRAGLKRIPRRHQTRKGEITLRDCKVRITMFVDADVLEYFKARAAQPNAAPYQTQINQALREVMDGEVIPTETNTKRGAYTIFQDEKFIATLNKHIDERLKSKGRRRRSSTG